MNSLFDREGIRNGPDETRTELRAAYFEEVIPMYLGLLESEGKPITPCLIHSDL